MSLKDQKKNYQRLEFLGDRVLNLIVSHYLYRNYPEWSEGDLTNKLRFTSNDNLDEIIDNFDAEFKGELAEFKREHKPDPPDMSADDIEAFTGKYFLDHGLDATNDLLIKNLVKEIEAFDPGTDFISRLQVHSQKELKIIPDYNIKEGKENNQQMFFCQVFIDEQKSGEGSGTSKPKAKQQAASDAMKNLNLI